MLVGGLILSKIAGVDDPQQQPHVTRLERIRVALHESVEGRGKPTHAKTIAFIEENLKAWGAPVAEGDGKDGSVP